MKRLLLVAGLMIAGCETPPANLSDVIFGEGVSKVTLPDGKPGYIVNCDARGMEACYSRARHLCNGNYSVVDRTDRSDDNGGSTRRMEIVCSA